MSTNSSIEWTDTTWNPVVGCRAYSPGCANCYAETMSVRLAGMATAGTAAGKNPGRKAHYLNVVNNGGWRGNVELVPEAMTDPFKWRKPRRVFVNSMSDLFYGDDRDRRACESMGIPFQPVPFDFIDRVFAVMALTPQHTFQVLTKRPARMAEYLRGNDRWVYVCNAVWQMEKEATDQRFADHANRVQWQLENYELWPLPGVWLGTSIENQQTADERIPHLLRCPAAVRFLSCEPLLGAVDLTEIDTGRKWPFKSETSKLDALRGFASSQRDEPNPKSISRDGQIIEHERCRFVDTEKEAVKWVIVGGESGPGARPCNVEWIRNLIGQCKAAGVACFVKQLGSHVVTPHSTGNALADAIARKHGINLIEEHWKPNDRKGGDPAEWPENMRVREMPEVRS